MKRRKPLGTRLQFFKILKLQKKDNVSAFRFFQSKQCCSIMVIVIILFIVLIIIISLFNVDKTVKILCIAKYLLSCSKDIFKPFDFNVSLAVEVPGSKMLMRVNYLS